MLKMIVYAVKTEEITAPTGLSTAMLPKNAIPIGYKEEQTGTYIEVVDRKERIVKETTRYVIYLIPLREVDVEMTM